MHLSMTMTEFLAYHKLAANNDSARRMLWAGKVKINGKLATVYSCRPLEDETFSVGKQSFCVDGKGDIIPFKEL